MGNYEKMHTNSFEGYIHTLL
jgi:hypothetical protein